jgi:N-acyl homoserine lactone hydrolase
MWAWLVRSGDEAILVDTGPPNVEWCARNTLPVRDETERQLHEALARHGLTPRRVRAVVLTHLHWDHCYGAPVLPNARLLVQDREIRYGVHPNPDDDRRKYEFSRGAPFLGDLRRMEAVQGASDVVPGIRIVPTPGHSPGHQSVLVDGRSRTYLLAGDFLDLYENWTERCPSGSTVDLEAWERSYDEVSKLDVEILPGHDPLVLRQEIYR